MEPRRLRGTRIDPMPADVVLGAIDWEMTFAVADAAALLAAVADVSGWE